MPLLQRFICPGFHSAVEKILRWWRYQCTRLWAADERQFHRLRDRGNQRKIYRPTNGSHTIRTSGESPCGLPLTTPNVHSPLQENNCLMLPRQVSVPLLWLICRQSSRTIWNSRCRLHLLALYRNESSPQRSCLSQSNGDSLPRVTYFSEIVKTGFEIMLVFPELFGDHHFDFPHSP